MKKTLILSAIAISGLIYNTADAQIGVNVGLRAVYAPATIERPIYEQAPVYNDSNADDYYYLPDVDAYYDVNDQCYFYFDGTNWISAAYLPGEYRDYDWRNARRFEVRDYRPYLRADFYRSKYDGHRFAEWGHRDYDRHSDGAYANHDNHYNEHRFDNRGHEGYGRPQPNRRENGHFNLNVWGQADNNHRDRDDHSRNNGDRFGNRGQEQYHQPAEPNRDNGGRFNNHDHGNSGQPSNQESNHDHGNNGQQSNQQNGHSRGGNDHSQNKPNGGFGGRKFS